MEVKDAKVIARKEALTLKERREDSFRNRSSGISQ